MTVATMTQKGQITIPKKIREALNLHMGDKVDFIEEPDGTVKMTALSRKVDDVFAILSHKSKGTYSIENIDRKLKESLRGRSR